MTDPLLLGIACGAGAGIATAGRRIGLASRRAKRLTLWRRLQHAASGCILAGIAGTGVALLSVDFMPPHRVLGMVLLTAAAIDMSTSEGLAWLAEMYLRKFRGLKSQEESDDNESSGTSES